MEHYLEIIKMAILIFPFLSFIISIPFILIQYHKYGSISFFKACITYSFVFYLLCAYFLVILPLPKISEVASLTTPRVQLIPFDFIVDFIKHSTFSITNINTVLPAIKESYFYVPVYNILLTFPFGIYLRYYFKCDMKKTIFFTFLLSLFFELTQLSGLYFIYPRGYRLFDVDDLLLNTLGGWIGYLLAKPLIKVLPNRATVNLKTKERGKKVSGFKRTTAFFLDLFLYSCFTLLFQILFASSLESTNIILISIFIYYFLVPTFLNCSTLGEKYLNIQVVDDKNTPNIKRLFLRRIIFILFYVGIPYLFEVGITNIHMNEDLKDCMFVLFFGIILLFYMISMIKYVFTNKKMLYEKVSKTKQISTIK